MKDDKFLLRTLAAICPAAFCQILPAALTPSVFCCQLVSSCPEKASTKSSFMIYSLYHETSIYIYRDISLLNKGLEYLVSCYFAVKKV